MKSTAVTRVICERVDLAGSVWVVIKSGQRGLLVGHLSEAGIEQAIEDAQKADETRLVRRLCFVKALYEGKTQQHAGDAVGVSQATSSAVHARGMTMVSRGCAHASAAGRRSLPPNSGQMSATVSKQASHGHHARFTLIKDRYDVTYHPTHLARKLRASGMHYAKPRPMDPRSPENAEEILAERLTKALGEVDTEGDDPIVFGFFR